MPRPSRLRLTRLEDRTVPSGTVSLVSRADPAAYATGGGGGSNFDTARQQVSDDGRFVVFTSRAPNLVTGQTDFNAASDVFLYDRALDSTALVSRSATGPSVTANGASLGPVISGDGRFVAFQSSATDLVAGFSGSPGNVFLYDRLAGTTALVSHSHVSPVTAGDAASGVYLPFYDQPGTLSITGDGRFVGFESLASDLVAGFTDSNLGFQDVYLYDRLTGQNTLVSHGAGSATNSANSGSQLPAVSHDGQFVAFASYATDVVAPFASTTNYPRNVYLYDRVTGATVLASHGAGSPTTGGDGRSIGLDGFENPPPTVSGDGRYVVFQSYATNLVAGFIDANGSEAADVFVFDRLGGAVTLVSRAAGWTSIGGNGRSGYRSHGGSPGVISRDGTRIAFSSDATSLVAGFTGRVGNVFAYDIVTGVNELVSHVVGAPTYGASGSAPVISADGRYVAFVSSAPDLLAGFVNSNGSGGHDVFVADRVDGSVALASHKAGAAATGGTQGSRGPVAISADGSAVAFASWANDLVTGFIDGTPDLGQGTDVYVFDRAGGQVALASRRAADRPAVGAGAFTEGMSYRHQTSDDGRFVVFTSNSVNLVPGQIDTNETLDVYLFDRTAGTTTLVSHAAGAAGQAANAVSAGPVISGDGRYVAFASGATDLIAGFTGGAGSNLFLYDRVTGVTELVSRQAGTAAAGGGVPVISFSGSGRPTPAGISADGRFIAYVSSSVHLVGSFTPGDSPYVPNLYLYDRTTGVTTLVNHRAGSPNTAPSGGSGFFWADWQPMLSRDGRFVAYASAATDLIAGFVDGNGPGGWDVYLFDRLTGVNELVTRKAGTATTSGNARSWEPSSISDDGRFTGVASDATDLVAGFSGPAGNAFVYDRATGVTTLVSHVAGSPTSAARGYAPVVSGDGRFVAFGSHAANVVAGVTDENISAELYLFDRTNGTAVLVSHAPGQPSVAAGFWPGKFTEYGVSADGRVITYVGPLTYSAGAPLSVTTDIFRYDRMTGENVRVTRSAGGASVGSNHRSSAATLSRDGSVVVFGSYANNLVPEDRNAQGDMFAYVAAPPRVATVVVANGDQRSVVRTLTVTFDQPVAFAADVATAFTLLRTGPGAPVASVGLAATVAGGPATSVTLTFAGPLTGLGSLIDGSYRLLIDANQVSAFGALDGDGDGQPGGTFTFDFHRLFGDADGDRDVDATDLRAFRAAFGNASNLAFDSDNDGDVDAADFGQFRRRFGTSV